LCIGRLLLVRCTLLLCGAMFTSSSVLDGLNQGFVQVAS
jgi:hypothetical protein